MVGGGVALWSAPVVASAAFSRRGGTQQVPERWGKSSEPAAQAQPAGNKKVAGPTGSCIGYPANTCLTFECLGTVTVCGSGPGGTQCFCDVDITGACVCRNDAKCSDIASCGANADCPPGWFCIPTSCCGGAKCAPPCGVSAGDGDDD